MSERSTPRPIPEARPPHLPDALTRRSPWVYLFLALALLHLWRGWNMLLDDGPIARVESIPLLVHAFIPSVVIPLYGVALFTWHPHAKRTMPVLAFGVALLSLGELLRAFDAPIRELLPGTRSFPAFEVSVADAAFDLVKGLVTIFGVLCIGAGLSAARQASRSSAERPIAIVIGALAFVSIALSVLALTELALGDYPASIVVVVIIGIVVSALITVAWVYLASVAIGGWLAREGPRRAWTCAGIGAVLLFTTRLLASSFIGNADFAYPVAMITGNTSIFGWLLLLLAFALGLPATGDPPEATPPGSATD